MGRECLSPPIARHDLELHPHSRCELICDAVEYRCVQKDILAAVVCPDKSITAFLIELQHSSCSQLLPLHLEMLQ
jgi:hypothetical protein